MPRLIDAERLHSHLTDWAYAIAPDERDYDKEMHHKQIVYSTIMDAVYAVEQAPTVDAVPVVRCKDCKWWDDIPSSTYTPQYHRCRKINISMTAEDFCSFGERKEDEQA